MPTSAWIEVPVSSIETGPRLRNVDPATVENLKVSIQESGWFGSILVRPLPCGEGESRFGLVAGAHRLAAMKALGRTRIAATIRVLSDDEAEQIEIDENLVRRGLTPLERAEMVAARFAVWGRRFPDRVQSVGEGCRPKRGRPKKGENFSQFPPAMGFASDTAADVGLTKRTIEHAWATVNGLPEALRLRLRGTWIAKNEGVLRQLAGVADREEQAKVAEILLAGQTKSVADAIAIANGSTPARAAPTPVDETLKAFRRLWGSASPSAKAAILHELAGKKLPAGYSVTETVDG
jgi:ParB family transcriptional regulator, chromosome partitioning protein